MFIFIASASIVMTQIADSPEGPPRAMAACRSLTDDVARLACYDSAMQEFAVDPEQDRQAMMRARRQQFGLTGAARPPVAVTRKTQDPKIDRIDAKIQSVAAAGEGRYSVRLDDGATWTFVEEVFVQPKPGDAITIRRGLLGSYMGSVNDRRDIRIQRRQ